MTEADGTAGETEVLVPPSAEPDDWSLVRDLIVRAENGDVDVMPLLRQVLDANPPLWQQAGDLALQARDAQLHLIAGDNLFIRETVSRQLAAVEAELAESVTTPLEKLLVQRIAVCWLQAHHADLALADADEGSGRHRQYLQVRSNGANRRFLHAARQFATVRHLLQRTVKSTRKE